jgi:hypothetical protein
MLELRQAWLAPLRAVFPFPLVSWFGGWVDRAVSGGLLLLLLASRLLLLPRGPWEQDEALLACGVLDFDPAHHMPLPPGFPLWILLGRLVRMGGAADPLLALQIASALLSVLGVWALVGVWAGVVGRAVAGAGALMAAFLPGVWFHAARGFSETGAATCVVVGVALWLRGGAAAFPAGVVAFTAAALIRPPLAPLVAVGVLLAAWGVRRQPRRLLAAAASSTGLAGVVLAPLVVEAGGWGSFVRSIASHGSEHLSHLGLEGFRFADLGFVRGLGTGTAAAVFALLAALGWGSLRRALGWRFWAGSALGVWLLYLLLFLHNRTYPRYWVLAWVLLATPAVQGVRTLVRSARVAAATGVVAAVLAGWWAWPALLHVHSRPLPVVAALEVVATEGAGTLVFEDQLFSFRNLYARQRRLPGGSLRVSEIPPRRLNLGGNPLWFLTESEGKDIPSNASEVVSFACDEPRVARLSQGRFLRARLVRNPVLAWRGASVPELDSLSRFIWCEGTRSSSCPPCRAAGRWRSAARSILSWARPKWRLPLPATRCYASGEPPGGRCCWSPSRHLANATGCGRSCQFPCTWTERCDSPAICGASPCGSSPPRWRHHRSWPVPTPSSPRSLRWSRRRWLLPVPSLPKSWANRCGLQPGLAPGRRSRCPWGGGSWG